MAVGRLIVSPEGISGIILLRWKDIRSIKTKNSQNIELLRREKFFGLPIGTRKVVLNFQNAEEAASFDTAVKVYIPHVQ